MIAETSAQTGESSSIDGALFSGNSMDISESHLRTLREIRNNVEQIHEIAQSLATIRHEIVDELIKLLQLNNKPLRLENTEGVEFVIHPNGYALIPNAKGEMEPRRLTDFEPSSLPPLFTQLIPKLSSSLGERKRSDENLLEKLIRVRDAVI